MSKYQQRITISVIGGHEINREVEKLTYAFEKMNQRMTGVL